MADLTSQTATAVPPLLWSYDETREALGGLSERTVFRLAERGDITRCRIGGRTFIVADSVKAFVARKVANG